MMECEKAKVNPRRQEDCQGKKEKMGKIENTKLEVNTNT